MLGTVAGVGCGETEAKPLGVMVLPDSAWPHFMFFLPVLGSAEGHFQSHERNERPPVTRE